MIRHRSLAIIAPALLFVLTGVTAAALVDHGIATPLSTNLSVGILSSLIAAAIASAIGVVFAVLPRQTADVVHPPGLVRVKAKKDLTPDEWLELLYAAKKEFYIAGHSLGKWCGASTRAEFISHIRRVLDNNGRVTLVMLAPNSSQVQRLQKATSVDYTSRIELSLGVLTDLAAQLQQDSLARLKIAVLSEHQALPYMVVGNERRLVTATYLGNSHSHDVACLEFVLSSPAARAVYDDFHALAQDGVERPLVAGASQSSHPKQRSRLNPFSR